ncbi:MAG TPA: hypothetical protein VFK05_03815 [Polyangiaceae bacterium]|nr:hypothetical protein [Polyangiaceae bacterium]
MMLKRSTNESKPGFSARLVRAGAASLAAAGAMAALATGCLDRPVVKQSPTTSNVFVDQIVQTAVDKIDLLFMIDNSVSMQDKQEILKAAVPVLVKRLISPICVDADEKPTGESSVNGHCTKGAAEFSPIGDIHIGIVSSSLGAHGGYVCSMPDGPTGTPDDKARLIPSVRTGVASWNDKGFLAWDPTGMKNNPPGEANAANLNTAFQNMIAAVGEHGCGYEASLESWYRFLVDPEPPAEVTSVKVGNGTQTVRNSKLTVNADGSFGACDGCDATLLQQRKLFLRPDSLVAIVMLSDENDCSIRDDSVGWFVGSQNRMPKSTVECASNPNNPCCRSCALNEGTPPAGCGPISQDANCKDPPANSFNTWDLQNDSPNLRCYNQRQRFGFDLLYDTNRYVNALKSTTIALQSTGQVVTNPLYDNAGSDKAPRDPSLVFLAGIVGVPWQDIATPASLQDPKALTYMTAKELVENQRWNVLLGDPHPKDGSAPKPPTDPFMIESPTPRSGSNPIVNVAISPANSTNPKANVINGHEQNIPALDDLQYACIFPLQKSKQCMEGDAACDCSPAKGGSLDKVTAANSPLCQGANGAISATQVSAKAYPGARELQVLKDFGDNAIVASICPKVTTTTGDPAADPNYGYNPAVGAIIERLKDALKGKCLPRKIQSVPIDPDHPELGAQVACKVVEAQKGNACNCDLPGRQPVDAQIIPAVRKQLQLTGQCGNGTQGSCDDWCECEIKQEDQANLAACQAGSDAPPGYCYVDNPASPLLKDCPSNQKQLLRFVDDNTNKIPAQGAVAFIACLGASEDPDEPTSK